MSSRDWEFWESLALGCRRMAHIWQPVISRKKKLLMHLLHIMLLRITSALAFWRDGSGLHWQGMVQLLPGLTTCFRSFLVMKNDWPPLQYIAELVTTSLSHLSCFVIYTLQKHIYHKESWLQKHHPRSEHRKFANVSPGGDKSRLAISTALMLVNHVLKRAG